MKLRIQGDTIRLRLTQSEVAAVANGDAIAETTALPQPFTYTLETAGEEIGAAFANGRMTVNIPEPIAARWAGTEEVSLRGRQGEVEILVEKDFACLVPREGEEKTDAFPNPLATPKQRTERTGLEPQRIGEAEKPRFRRFSVPSRCRWGSATSKA